jgi:hypothetical protein
MIGIEVYTEDIELPEIMDVSEFGESSENMEASGWSDNVWNKSGWNRSGWNNCDWRDGGGQWDNCWTDWSNSWRDECDWNNACDWSNCDWSDWSDDS